MVREDEIAMQDPTYYDEHPDSKQYESFHDSLRNPKV